MNPGGRLAPLGLAHRSGSDPAPPDRVATRHCVSRSWSAAVYEEMGTTIWVRRSGRIRSAEPLDQAEAQRLPERAAEASTLFETRLTDGLAGCRAVRGVRVHGLLIAIEMNASGLARRLPKKGQIIPNEKVFGMKGVLDERGRGFHGKPRKAIFSDNDELL